MSANSFDELLKQLITRYKLPSKKLTELTPLADQTNRLTPAFSTLSEDIYLSLPVTDFSDVESHKELAMLAAQSTDALHQKQNDVKSFAESICFEAIELRVRGQHVPEAKASALRSARGPLCRAVRQVNQPLQPVLTAELMAQPLEAIKPVAFQWYRDASHTVAAHLLLSMHMLVQLDVVGLVEWPGETTCKLNFFRHVVTQDQVRRRRTQSVQDNGLDDDGLPSVRLDTWEHIEGRNRYSIECHEHHVIDAEVKPIGSAIYPIPADKQAFLEQTPPWIKQHLKILEGDLILERVIERNVGEDLWKTTPQLRSSYEIEPAIVLGHYVISGWGETEIRKEEIRRKRLESANSLTSTSTSQHVRIEDKTQTETRRKHGEQFSNLKPITVTAASASVISMLLCWLQPQAMVPVAVIAALVAIGLCVKTATSYSIWKHSSVDWMFVTASAIAVASGIFAILAALYGLIFLNLSTLLSACLLAAVSYATKHVARARAE